VSVLGKYPVEIIDTNEAPVISMSDANKAVLAGTTLKAGESLETLIPTILSMIQINDPEDGVITATAGMINVGNLNITNPTMGTYDLVVNVSDSKGKAAVAYTLKLSVVTVIDDFEVYVLDQGYSATAKGDFTRLYAFRSDGSSWTVSPAVVGTLIDNSGNKMFSVAYKYVNGNMNGIRINVTKAELEALGAQYIGIYLKTSAPLSSGSKFQFFKYSASATEVTAVGTSSFADEGTYVWIAVSQLDSSTTSVAFMMNVVSADSGTLYLDNIVIK
jgi:hypothetical protein